MHKQIVADSQNRISATEPLSQFGVRAEQGLVWNSQLAGNEIVLGVEVA